MEGFVGVFLALIVFGGCGTIGWYFLDFSLYQNLDEKDFKVQVRLCMDPSSTSGEDAFNDVCSQMLWSVVFALSCNLLVLVLYEIMGVMDPG